jgi:MiaB/RimO family radical SAM methylthiotransferase
MKVFLRGLNGCVMRKQKLNQYRQLLAAGGHEIVENIDDSDVCLVWTCAFRGDFLNNSLAIIDDYLKNYKGKIIVGGCLPDIAPEELKRHFTGPVMNWRDDLKKLAEFFGGEVMSAGPLSPVFIESKLCDDAEQYRKEHPDKDAQFHDQFIKLVISEGCNFSCAYCSERLAFPPYRSFPEDELVDACRRMVAQTGDYHIVLLADSLGEYGHDIGSSLPNLMGKLRGVHPEIKIALNNMNPASFIKYFDEMTGFIKAGAIRHLNLPIQSASPRILKLMNRSYTREDIDKIFGWLNTAGFKEFDTHVIIGFPGEMDEDVDETIDFIVRHKPKYVLASKYLEVPGMAASKLPGKVDEATRRRRLYKFAERMKEAAIICNSEEGVIIKNRFQRIKKGS